MELNKTLLRCLCVQLIMVSIGR